MNRTLFFAPLLGLLLGCSNSSSSTANYPSGNGLSSPSTQLVAMDPVVARDYREVIARVEGMVGDERVRSGAARRGLDVLNVTWEDTGRAQGSSLGPNISDLTLQVRYKDDAGVHSALMPVLRFPNFSDRTGDVSTDKFFVRVGNERDESLQSVPLTRVLRDIHSFASVPSSLGDTKSLLAPRDSHFLMSAQAVFLPIPREGKAEFNPVLFNYQSAPESPAVLTLLVTRQGTSIKVIENRTEDQSVAGWGQELYFNLDGERSAFTAERKSDVEARIASQGGPKSEDDRSALARGADVLFIVQVPLKHKQRGYLGGAMPQPPMAMAPPPEPSAMMAEDEGGADADEESDVEQAVLGHGDALGPFEEGYGRTLERDPKFPIRITVQFYKATSNGVVNDRDLDAIAQSIGGVYEHADFVGSLVLPQDDALRPTAWQTIPNEWFPW